MWLAQDGIQTSKYAFSLLGNLWFSFVDIGSDSKRHLNAEGVLYFSTKESKSFSRVLDKEIEEFVIPDGYEEIASDAFSGCNRLKSIVIPEGIKVIRANAFEGCSSLELVIIPKTVFLIEHGVFKDCSRLKSITIPERVKSIGSNAFEGCSSLTCISVDEKNFCYTSVNGVLYTKRKKILVCCPANFDQLAFDNVLQDVVVIGTGAFEGCKQLRLLAVPETVERIESNAFLNCDSLECVYIPHRVIIEDKTFLGSSSLKRSKDFLFINSARTDGFYFKSSLRTLTIPNGVLCIEHAAFSGCSSLESIIIPDGVKEICSSAFAGCSSLKSIKIPDSVKEICSSAFAGCSSLQLIKIPDSVEFIGYVWKTLIDSPILSLRYSISSIIRDLNEKQGSKVFIDEKGEKMFVDASPFAGCSSLTTIDVDVNNRKYCSVNGVLFTSDKRVLVAYPAGRNEKEYTIPDGVERIAHSAFRDCSSLKSIMIPNSMNEIGSCAFSGCSSLKSLKMNNVKKIGNLAFSQCSKLTFFVPKDSKIKDYLEASSMRLTGRKKKITVETF